MKKPGAYDFFIFLTLLSLLLWGLQSFAQKTKDLRVPIPVGENTYLAPDMTEIKGYFYTILIALAGFLAKEIYSAYKKSKDTTSEDIKEIKKDMHVLINQNQLLFEQMKNKADRIEVTREILDRVQKEIEHASRLQR